MNLMARPLVLGNSTYGSQWQGAVFSDALPDLETGFGNESADDVSLLPKLGIIDQGVTGLVARHMMTQPNAKMILRESLPEQVEVEQVALIAKERADQSLTSAHVALALGAITLLPGCDLGAEIIHSLFPLNLEVAIPLMLNVVVMSLMVFSSLFKSYKDIDLKDLLTLASVVGVSFFLMGYYTEHILMEMLMGGLSEFINNRSTREEFVNDLMVVGCWGSFVPMLLFGLLKLFGLNARGFYEKPVDHEVPEVNLSKYQLYDTADVANLRQITHKDERVRSHILKVAALRKDLIRQAFEEDRQVVVDIFSFVLDKVLSNRLNDQNIRSDAIQLLIILCETFPEHSDFDPMVRTFSIIDGIYTDRLPEYYRVGLAQLDSEARVKFMIELAVRCIITEAPHSIYEHIYKVFYDLFSHSLQRSERAAVLKAIDNGNDGLSILHTRLSSDFFRPEPDSPWARPSTEKDSGAIPAARAYITDKLPHADSYFTEEHLAGLTVEQLRADFDHLCDDQFADLRVKWSGDLTDSLASADFEISMEIRLELISLFSGLRRSQTATRTQRQFAADMLTYLTGKPQGLSIQTATSSAEDPGAEARRLAKVASKVKQ